MNPKHDLHRKPKRDEEAIRFTADGFELLRGGKSKFQVRWADVRGIAAWKIDCFAVDMICLGFRVDPSWEYWLVSEDADGYDQLVQQVEQRYPDHNANWWSQTAFPPFRTCWTVVWGDAPEPTTCSKCGHYLGGESEYKCQSCGLTNDPTVCQACSGEGRLRTSVGFWIGAVMFALLSGVLFPQALAGPWLARLVALAGAGYILYFAISSLRKEPCEECNGTGTRLTPDERLATMQKPTKKRWWHLRSN